MKRTSIWILVVCLFASAAMGQEIKKVWEYLNTDENNPLPILKVQDGYPYAETLFQGDSPTDSLTGLKRYDADRLLLGIRENGIQEGTDGADEELAAQYPDRSLIWIDPSNGQPMGVALVVGVAPHPLSDDYVAGGGAPESYYFNWGVAEDGVIYVGYKNMILRYAPSGDGFAEPTVAFEVPEEGVDGSGGAQYFSWRWGDVEVKGAGADTVIFAGGKTWRESHGYRELVTDDGETFTQKAYVPNGWAQLSGGASQPINHNGQFPLDAPVVYGSSYPGSDGGTGTTIYRYLTDGEGYIKDSEFWSAQKLEEPLNPDDEMFYQTQYISDVDAADGLDYVVAYSTPSWNTHSSSTDSETGEPIWKPGWLAVHDVSGSEAQDGSVLSYYKIETYENTELYDKGSTDEEGNLNETAEWHGTQGELDINVLPDFPAGACEILWEGGIYGYGRYVIGVEVANIGDWSLF